MTQATRRGLIPAALAAALLLPGCVSGPNLKPDLKDIRPLPKFFLQELVTRRNVSGLRMSVFNTGSFVVPGESLSEMKSPAAQVRLDIPAFLVSHPGQGLILFDTGLPPAAAAVRRKTGRDNEFRAPFQIQPGRDLAAQLGAAGFKPGQVRWVVLSHLHWDHAGLVEAFPNATVLVDRREWEAQRLKTAQPGADPLELDPAALEPRLRLKLVDLSSAPSYGVFDHAEDLFRDGTVYLLDLSGHTPGSLGLWANLDSGPVLLAGDASWVLDNHQDLALPLKETMADPLQYWRKVNMLRRMQEAVPQLIIFPGHDLMPLKLQPRPDLEYTPPPP